MQLNKLTVPFCDSGVSVEKYHGQVHWPWDQVLKKQMKPLRIRLLTDLYRDIDFYQGRGLGDALPYLFISPTVGFELSTILLLIMVVLEMTAFIANNCASPIFPNKETPSPQMYVLSSPYNPRAFRIIPSRCLF